MWYYKEGDSCFLYSPIEPLYCVLENVARFHTRTLAAISTASEWDIQMKIFSTNTIQFKNMKIKYRPL